MSHVRRTISAALAVTATTAACAAIAPSAQAAVRCPAGAVCLYPEKQLGGQPYVAPCAGVAGVVVQTSGQANRASSAVNNCSRAAYLWDGALFHYGRTQRIKVRKSLWIGPRQAIRDLGARGFDNITDGLANVPRPTVNF